MAYKNASVTLAKKLLVSRLSFILKYRLHKTTGKALAEEIGVSPNMISKLKNNNPKGISFDAILEVAIRLKLKYSLVLESDGKGNRNVNLDMEDVSESKARALSYYQRSPQRGAVDF